MIDLASDTVTQPTPAMRAAMAAAPVGDDVFGEDPTVNALEAKIAGMLGKEAAVYVPSGTMSNQLAVRAHCGPGDEFLCDTRCHIFTYEQGAYAQLFGVAANPIVVTGKTPTVAQLDEHLRPDDPHSPRSRLLCLENTLNRGSGCVLALDEIDSLCSWAKDHGMARHLDGARLFNAVVATGIPATEWARHFDTVSICFSKGLGAPVGSALCGTQELIDCARRTRKALGGGMRQAGIVAAGAIYALDHHIDRLADDHAHAQVIADSVRQTPGLTLAAESIDTNIVMFNVDPSLATAQELCDRLQEYGIRMFGNGRNVRAVTHLEITRADAETVAKSLQSFG